MSLAQISLIQGEYDNAISLYENVLDIQPGNAVATNNLAMVLVSNKSDHDNLIRAQNLIQNSKSQDHPALLDTLGWVYFHLGEYDNAHSALDKAITLAPNIPSFHYHKGAVYIKELKNQYAMQSLQKALSLGNFPERADAQKALELITLSSKK